MLRHRLSEPHPFPVRGNEPAAAGRRFSLVSNGFWPFDATGIPAPLLRDS
ncbi:hypothetical protein M717_02275 [Neisseria gonorrhoeae SK33414]|nr:hypothetical protein M717_02275 [Neisseria gonorrhoeae SK33414]KLR83014.1 hypothetical protein M675_04685 [Neisseria gonorrhoeae SK1902]KLS03633.1 hypothetical protein M688_01175 [Neisseria gonorrhoeae SK22871]KLS05370.1 hypothetical protein M725_04345 [Neisseria gonorrhoeae ATL_2011_01_08]KLS12016.1 hypothetical protein M726_00385 [Neisseria gonorrhoeae ATL_2011_01_17]KLS37141.1 hypothetical protein M735_00920 [Neisseria gonorrhoeae MIA_2011_03-09]KLS46060.1 hypothetical protein M730_0071